MKKIILIVSFMIFATYAQAADIYVDATLGANCVSGDYSKTNRTCTGVDGNAYNTPLEAINSMSSGDDIYLRGGTYIVPYLAIPTATAGTAQNYSSIQSYPGEWAILDGNRATSNGVVIGRSGFDGSVDIDYWKFERLGITGGGRDDTVPRCAGIWAGGKGIIIRYCHIYSNLSYTASENPAGIVGLMLEDAIIEYNLFDNNGSILNPVHNAANVMIFSDYSQMTATRNTYTATNGFDGLYGTQNNKVRYNYFKNAVVGFKHKGTQLLSGRNEAGGSGWDDTYILKGDELSYNIFEGHTGEALYIDQDFTQVHNNIVEGSLSTVDPAIAVQYYFSESLYKVGVYNNSIINAQSIAIVRYGMRKWAFEELKHFGFDYNNIIVGGNTGAPGGVQNILTVTPYHSTGNPNEFDLTSYVGAYNLFYNPGDETSQIRLYDVSYNETNYEAQLKTNTPKDIYVKTAATGLFSSGYITDPAYVVEGATTIANGGANISNPYRPGNIPGYVGATNPNDNVWVAGVLALDVTYFTGQAAGSDPSWVESDIVVANVISTTDGQTVSSPSFTINGTATATAGRTITSVTIPGETVTADDGAFNSISEAWTCNVTLAEGANSYTATATDSSAETGQDSISVTYTPVVSTGVAATSCIFKSVILK